MKQPWIARTSQGIRFNTCKDLQAGGFNTAVCGQPHFGCKALTAADETHLLICAVSLTGANVHNSREFEAVVLGGEEMVMADKAYWNREHNEWYGWKDVATGILCESLRGELLKNSDVHLNHCSVRSGARLRRCWAGESGVRVNNVSACSTDSQPADHLERDAKNSVATAGRRTKIPAKSHRSGASFKAATPFHFEKHRQH